MEKIIKNFLKLKLDLSLFFNIDFNEREVRIVGYYTIEADKHLLEKGFEEDHYLYKTNEKAIEFKKDNVKIVLYLK